MNVFERRVHGSASRAPVLILPRRRAGFSSTSRVLHQLNIRVSMFSHQHLNLLRVCVCAGSRWRKQITFLLYLTFRRHSASSATAAGIKPPFGPPPRPTHHQSPSHAAPQAPTVLLTRGPCSPSVRPGKYFIFLLCLVCFC